MSTRPASNRKWFLLIGINFYMPGELRKDSEGKVFQYPNLLGSVHDVNSFESYLQRLPEISNDCIVKLTSTARETEEVTPKEEERYWPTSHNILHHLDSLTERAHAGDLVHIHYSGHGGRAKTVYPELKGINGFDESLVPCDIHCGGQYIRDVEMARRLDKMVKKGLILTVVLDSCHSGSATRNPTDRAIPRGIGKLDATILDSDWPTPESSELLRGYCRNSSVISTETSAWLLEPKGYELLAACRFHEKAREAPIESGQYSGVLSSYLLKSLQDYSGSKPLTHGILYQRLFQQIQTDYIDQTPVFAGNGNRMFFRSDERLNVSSIAVKGINNKEDKVILRAGKAQGLMVDSEYALYPWDIEDIDTQQCRAKVRVIKVSDLESLATFFEGTLTAKEIGSGYMAVPLKTPIPKMAIRIVSDSSLSNLSSGDSPGHKLARFQQEVTKRPDLPLRLLSSDEDGNTAVHVGVDSYGKYILLGTINSSFTNFFPCKDLQSFLNRLAHLAKYEMVRQLRNHAPLGALEGNTVRFERTDKTSKPIEDESSVSIRFENRSQQPLNLVIFDLQPLWGITQIYPEYSVFETVDANDERTIELQMSIPEEVRDKSKVLDVLKAFITTQPTSFRSLELPDLSDSPDQHLSNTRGTDALGRLLESLGTGHRNARARSAPKQTQWLTSEITIETYSKVNESNASKANVQTSNHGDPETNNKETPASDMVVPEEGELKVVATQGTAAEV